MKSHSSASAQWYSVTRNEKKCFQSYKVWIPPPNAWKNSKAEFTSHEEPGQCFMSKLFHIDYTCWLHVTKHRRPVPTVLAPPAALLVFRHYGLLQWTPNFPKDSLGFTAKAISHAGVLTEWLKTQYWGVRAEISWLRLIQRTSNWHHDLKRKIQIIVSWLSDWWISQS